MVFYGNLADSLLKLWIAPKAKTSYNSCMTTQTRNASAKTPTSYNPLLSLVKYGEGFSPFGQKFAILTLNPDDMVEISVMNLGEGESDSAPVITFSIYDVERISRNQTILQVRVKNKGWVGFDFANPEYVENTLTGVGIAAATAMLKDININASSGARIGGTFAELDTQKKLAEAETASNIDEWEDVFKKAGGKHYFGIRVTARGMYFATKIIIVVMIAVFLFIIINDIK